MAVLRLFAAARTAAGTSREVLTGATVAEVLDHAVDRFGGEFAAVLPSCAIWVNGVPASGETVVGVEDEVGVLPPVSGGCAA
ncbi:MoaD/ThiS family protein [Aquihabitans sp. G128]|uniref:MoaD/ThiS family protein n=1 Tax=Aquihabitans sp. G128 TaxID=2849779 RepID=UPI001C229CC7|nr:MoaD/ThiS family protein [Aquihabitans sp. G128]QXC60127.1 MoaD/ThiS family protein [Aquihabitans sp. G128]